MKNQAKIIVILMALASCNSSLKQEDVLLSADMETPMGSNHLRIYNDHTFQFENRRLLKKTVYQGKVTIANDTLKFEYSEEIPDFGDTAIIDGFFLTYTNGIYRELLEISLNNISE